MLSGLIAYLVVGFSFVFSNPSIHLSKMVFLGGVIGALIIGLAAVWKKGEECLGDWSLFKFIAQLALIAYLVAGLYMVFAEPPILSAAKMVLLGGVTGILIMAPAFIWGWWGDLKGDYRGSQDALYEVIVVSLIVGLIVGLYVIFSKPSDHVIMVMISWYFIGNITIIIAASDGSWKVSQEEHSSLRLTVKQKTIIYAVYMIGGVVLFSIFDYSSDYFGKIVFLWIIITALMIVLVGFWDRSIKRNPSDEKEAIG